MINPFDLPGPQFLLFYAVCGLLVVCAVWIFQNGREGGPAPRVDMADPYLIAYLRGGATEAARVAAVSLIDRGLVVAKGRYLSTGMTPPGALGALEGAVLATVSTGATMGGIVTAPAVLAACEPYARTLLSHRLIPDASMRAARMRWRVAALATLVALAGAKIIVALSRGRTNIGFLVVLAIVFALMTAAITARTRTARGTAFLGDLRQLFGRLRVRASALEPGTATPDVVLAAAVFGVGVLPATRFPYVKELFPHATSSSSCGSSSGGCGGGSGGGCGGCGGGGGD